MSRSNPTDNSPNPSTRWHEWSGQDGVIRYYDREKKENITVGDKFVFILLDQLAVVKGWHDPSDSGITSNEVRDTKAETMIVKAFKGGILAEGLYASIRDRIKAQGGHFTANLYIAFKLQDKLALGSLQFKGAALNAWVDFSKANRADLYKKAIRINGFTEGKKGKITFRVPKFSISEITEQTDADAKALDEQLQIFLKGYFSRTRTQQVESPKAHEPLEEQEEYVPPPPPEMDADGVPAEDVPF